MQSKNNFERSKMYYCCFQKTFSTAYKLNSDKKVKNPYNFSYVNTRTSVTGPLFDSLALQYDPAR